MNDGTFDKIGARKAKEVCREVELEEAAEQLLTDQILCWKFLEALQAQELHADACRFLGAALPKREAVWWAWQCVRQGPPGRRQPQATQALEAAEKWLNDPSEDHRRAAQPAGEAAGFGTPAGAVAMAAFFSGGSLGPPDLPPVPPPEHLTGVAAANAVILVALLGPPDQARQAFQKFIALGLDVAKGTNRWKEPAPPAAAAKKS
jgi:hypothetical protein